MIKAENLISKKKRNEEKKKDGALGKAKPRLKHRQY